MTSFQVSSPMRRSKVSLVIPALATRTSTGPKLLHPAKAARPGPGRVTSHMHREQVDGARDRSPATVGRGRLR